MNTNYETVVSLIELLVKKAGFDLSKNYSEIELQKTKDSISSLLKERNTATNKEALNTLIENLKVRQANWENNAEMVGKSLLKAYEEGKDYNTVRMRIELLGNLALKGTDNISVGSVYDRVRSLDSEYKTLINRIENTDYRNEAEKEMDSRYKIYLETKLTSIEGEIEALDKELDNLREVELKDVGIVSKIKEYLNKLNADKEKIDKASKASINSDIAFDVWERLETAKNNTNEKLDKAKDLLSRTEEMLENVRSNRLNINERKSTLQAEQGRCKTKLNNVSSKLEADDYENNTERMIDVNNSEMMRLELESLNNKKDVVYVDVGKVKEELIKAWSKDRETVKKVKEVLKQDENIETIDSDIGIKETNVVSKEENNVNIELPKEPEVLVKPEMEADVEQVILDDNKDVDEAFGNIEKLIEKSENLMNTSLEVDVKPKVEEKATLKEVMNEKKNKIELDW